MVVEVSRVEVEVEDGVVKFTRARAHRVHELRRHVRLFCRDFCVLGDDCLVYRLQENGFGSAECNILFGPDGKLPFEQAVIWDPASDLLFYDASCLSPTIE
jgi:hypothetical protein